MNHVTWFVTSKCNLACEYCFTAFNKDFPSEDSSLETGKAIVEFLLMNSITQNIGLGFFGGEPLLQFSLMKQVVEYAEQRGRLARKRFNFSVTTNGTLIDEEKIAWFKEKGIMPLLSLDGMPHEGNKRVFHDGKPSAELALEKALMLLDVGMQPTIRWSLHPDGLGNLYSDTKELIRMGFNIIAVDPVYEVEWTETDKKQYEAELGKVAKLYLQHLRQGRNVVFKPIDDAIRLFAVDEKQKSRCGTATGGVGIDMAGKIYPCHRFVTRMGPVLGDVFNGWDEAALKQAQAWDVSKVHPEDGSCKDCPINLRCPGGGCICVNLDMCGDIYKSPQLYCELQLINQRVTNDIAFILHGEKNAIFKKKLEKPDLPT